MDIISRSLRRCLRGEHRQALNVLSQAYSYEQLLVGSDALRRSWGEDLARDPKQKHGPRIACLADSGPGFAITQWSTWMNGGIFVPLATSHPPASLQHSIADAEVSMVRPRIYHE
jgi:malonyl-CoA/methylmalonyl-CoA synthetase